MLCVFYHRGVNSNVISWNRVVLLHGKTSFLIQGHFKGHYHSSFAVFRSYLIEKTNCGT